MGIFSEAIKVVIENEGGYNHDDPNDLGGATNFGLSLRFLQSLTPISKARYHLPVQITPEIVQNITLEDAITIYQNEFWFDALTKISSQLITNFVFDMCVNHSRAEAIKILQRATWPCFQKDIVKDDGVLGDNTLHYVNCADEFCLMDVLKSERAGFMRLLAAINPKDKDNLNGWLNRCYEGKY